MNNDNGRRPHQAEGSTHSIIFLLTFTTISFALVGILAGSIFAPRPPDPTNFDNNNENPPDSTEITLLSRRRDAERNFATAASGSLVRLNVGGTKYQTSMQTLTAVPGSVLEGMFTDRSNSPLVLDEDGSFFIDRDGHTFAHLLNFLRDGALPSWELPLPDTKVLKQEAAYFGIAELEAWAGERLQDRHFTVKDLKNWIQVAQNGEDCTLDLDGLDGTGLDLERITFPSACRILARKSNFRHASLARVFAGSLSAAALGYRDFSMSDFGYTNMGTAALLGPGNFFLANFEGASLKGANFQAAKSGGVGVKTSLIKTSFSKADLSGAQFGGSINATLADFMHANLEGSTFSARGYWMQANFAGASLKKAEFRLVLGYKSFTSNAELSLDFTRAHFASADMEALKIQLLPDIDGFRNGLEAYGDWAGRYRHGLYRVASFERATFDGTNMAKIVINMAKMVTELAGRDANDMPMKRTDFKVPPPYPYFWELVVSFCGASFTGTNLTSAFIQGGVFDNLAGADLNQARFEQTLFLSGTRFDGARLEHTVFNECFIALPSLMHELRNLFSTSNNRRSPYIFSDGARRDNMWSSLLRPLQVTDLAGSLQTETAIILTAQ